MCYNCAGVLGCALADDEAIREFIPPWLNGNHSLTISFILDETHSFVLVCILCSTTQFTKTCCFCCVCVSVPGQIDSAAEDYLRVYNALDKLIALTRSTIKDPTALSDLDKLQKILEGSSDDDDNPAPMIYYKIVLLLA